MSETFDHIAIAVKDLETALKFYREAFGLAHSRIETYESIKTVIAYIPAGPVEIHLLSPSEPGAGSIGAFVESTGGGFHHMAFKTDDIEKTVGHLGTMHVGIRGNTIVDVRPGLRAAMTAQPDLTQNVSIELLERK